ncbi:MAG: HD domain-containing protein [Lachnospiraceae bacterium]|nr:HD domain-containing protein [Lachnospiraceae bacterium]
MCVTGCIGCWGGRAEELTAADAALLVMAAACHDIGMSVSEEQKKELDTAAQRPSAEWESYFYSHADDYEQFQSTGRVSDRMLRNFVRLHHHERVGHQLPSVSDWPRALVNEGISRDTLLRLCKSHGEPIEKLTLTAADERTGEYHLLPCAILLRLADILDFDASRAPEDLYHHLGLDRPRDSEAAFSKMEWDKNCTNPRFELVDGIVSFSADCTSMQVEHQVRAYMGWLQKELDECDRKLAGRADYWRGFQPPHKVEVVIHPYGYKSGPFCLTMEQDRILELLAGRNLYSDSGVFVRELLQNAIDAVRTRVAQDSTFCLEDGRVIIHTWMDNSGHSWFRIQDNGTGMDQDIILNHFLKVGSSYYNSDRFKSETRKYGTKSNYTPISRFGIGILSCFMSDPEHNKLQLSTKRFAQPGSLVPAAIRMNVDGLHGYYYLAEEEMQDGESDLLTMDHPSTEGDEENRYRSQAGTTICVQLNLYQLGGFRTLKELVDRYVQFPEVQVEYFGQEGHVVYPTQGELMAEVHALNPGGVGQPPKEYCYYISDEEFTELKREHPEIVWENDERPGIAVKYCPLDWMAPGDQVSGVAVVAEVIEPNCYISNKWLSEESSVYFSLSYESNEQRLKLAVGIFLPQEIEAKIPTLRRSVEIDYRMYFELLDEYPRYQKDPEWQRYISHKYKIEEAEIPQRYREAKRKKKEYGEVREQLNIYEKAQSYFVIHISYTELSAPYRLLNCLPGSIEKSGQKSVESRTIVAFNGILADQSQLLGKTDGFIGMILLLQQRYRPEVNLSRDTISELPLEALAVLDALQRKLEFRYGYRKQPEAFQTSRFCLKTETELQALLEEVPALKDELRLGSHTLREAAELLGQDKVVKLPNVNRDSLYHMLCLAAAKKMGTVFRNTKDYSKICLCSGIEVNSTTSFPVSLFIAWKGDNAPFANVANYWNSCINFYNPEHPVSQWLIGHQRELMEKVPGIYNTILEDMIMVSDKEKLREKLNDDLRRLQSIPGNPYEVSDSLFLKESDFA